MLPKRSSPFHHKQASLRAKFTQDRFGWELAERFTDPAKEKRAVEGGVGVGDISHLVKLSLKSSNVGQIVSRLYNRDEPEPLGRALGNGSIKAAICAVICKDEAMLVVGPGDKEPILKRLSGDQSNRLSPIDVSSVLAGAYILGPKSRPLLCRLTELNVNAEDFPNLTATHSPIRHVPTIILRFDLGNVLGYQLYFERTYSEYIWDAFIEAGKELGIVPVGFSAMKLLGWGRE